MRACILIKYLFNFLCTRDVLFPPVQDYLVPPSLLFFCLKTAFSLQIWSSSVGMTCNFGVLSNRNTFGSVV